MREVVNVKRWQRMWCCTHAKMKLQSNITGFDHAWILKESHTKSLSILLMSRLNQAAGTNCQNTTESKDLYNKDYKNRDSSVIFISMHIYIWLRVKSKSKSCEDECRLRVKRWIFIFLLHWSNISDSPTLILSLVTCYVACSDSQPAYMLVIQYVMMLWSMALFFVCLFLKPEKCLFVMMSTTTIFKISGVVTCKDARDLLTVILSTTFPLQRMRTHIYASQH